MGYCSWNQSLQTLIIFPAPSLIVDLVESPYKMSHDSPPIIDLELKRIEPLLAFAAGGEGNKVVLKKYWPIKWRKGDARRLEGDKRFIMKRISRWAVQGRVNKRRFYCYLWDSPFMGIGAGSVCYIPSLHHAVIRIDNHGVFGEFGELTITRLLANVNLLDDSWQRIGIMCADMLYPQFNVERAVNAPLLMNSLYWRAMERGKETGTDANLTVDGLIENLRASMLNLPYFRKFQNKLQNLTLPLSLEGYEMILKASDLPAEVYRAALDAWQECGGYYRDLAGQEEKSGIAITAIARADVRYGDRRAVWAVDEIEINDWELAGKFGEYLCLDSSEDDGEEDLIVDHKVVQSLVKMVVPICQALQAAF